MIIECDHINEFVDLIKSGVISDLVAEHEVKFQPPPIEELLRNC